MKNELTILLEKFLRRQITDSEVLRLKDLLVQSDATDLLSDLFDDKWEQASSGQEEEVENRIWSSLCERI